MVNMSGWWAAKLRVLCWETKKVGKKVKKQNKTKQNKKQTNVSQVGRDFFWLFPTEYFLTNYYPPFGIGWSSSVKYQ